jgi:pimeloyl-ACP methyl ester carboxylesterase
VTAGYSVSTRVGRIFAGELDYHFRPDEPLDKIPVVLLHGSGSANYANYVKGSSWATCVLGPRLAMEGRYAIAGTMAGQSFANDAVMSRIDAAMAYLGVDEAHLFGISMGGAVAVRYGSLNPAKTASIMGVAPLADIDQVYQDNRLGLRADIGTAWGVTHPAALPAQADLIGLHAPELADNDTPRRILYSTADTSTLPAEVEAMATAMDITPEIVDTSIGHFEGTTAKAMDLDPAAPWQDYIDWLDSVEAA